MPSLISFIYALAEYFPFWGIPLALILAELANHARKHNKKLRMAVAASLSLILIALSVVFFVYDGYRNTRPAMKQMERQAF